MNHSGSFSTQTAAWSSLDPTEKGFECVWLKEQRATGSLLRLDEDKNPLRLVYEFCWNSAFQVEAARIQTQKENRTLELDLRYDRGWYKGEERLTEFDACTDLDLWPTPLTNTFAIRRLNLAIGEKKSFQTLLIHGPTLQFRKVSQIYTRLDEHHYLFEDPAANFRARLQVDDQGLIMHYPELFVREA